MGKTIVENMYATNTADLDDFCEDVVRNVCARRVVWEIQAHDARVRSQ